MPGTPPFSRSYRRYALGMLTLVYTLNYLDRDLLILLLQPIKQDLNLSDTQLGFLTGIAFGLFYATLGIPIARWADRGNRATLTSVAIGLWGVTVMGCLWVKTFAQLVLARIAAAVGEAGCMPPTYSLVGDYFPGAAERTRAMAIYWLAGPLAALASFILGGRLNEALGWRLTFLVMGIPALLVAVVVKLTIAEPRQHTQLTQAVDRELPQMSTVLSSLWQQHSSRHLGLGIILYFTMGLGLAPWYAAFMMRSHGMGTAELGLWLGLIFGLSGIVGTLLGGDLTARWLGQDERSQLRLSAVLVALLVPCFILFLLVPENSEALIALAPLVFLGNFVLGPSFALLQRLVSEQTRATTLAVVMLLANLIGMGLGPQLVGIASDLLAPLAGADSLRYAMLGMSLVCVWSAWHFWRAAATVSRDLIVAEKPAAASSYAPILHVVETTSSR